LLPFQTWLLVYAGFKVEEGKFSLWQESTNSSSLEEKVVIINPFANRRIEVAPGTDSRPEDGL